MYVDPTGRAVRVKDKVALERIKSTLPEDLRERVAVGEDGLIQKGPLQEVETDDPNFLALRELVNDPEVTAVESAPAVRFINSDGEVVEEPFYFETREEVIEELVDKGVPREEAEKFVTTDYLLLGFFATPGGEATNRFDDRSTRSLTSEATVTVPDESVDAPEVERAKTTAHELYGHALLHQRGEPFTHPPVPESEFDEIERRTELNLVEERSDGPGVSTSEEEEESEGGSGGS